MRSLAGVLFVSSDARRARSAFDGTVHLEADHWPTYTVRYPTYEPFELTPEGVLDAWEDGLLVLDRIE